MLHTATVTIELFVSICNMLWTKVISYPTTRKGPTDMGTVGKKTKGVTKNDDEKGGETACGL